MRAHAPEALGEILVRVAALEKAYAGQDELLLDSAAHDAVILAHEILALRQDAQKTERWIRLREHQWLMARERLNVRKIRMAKEMRHLRSANGRLQARLLELHVNMRVAEMPGAGNTVVEQNATHFWRLALERALDDG